MNSDLIAEWRDLSRRFRDFDAALEASLVADQEPDLVEPGALPVGVIKQFSGEDGVEAWDGTLNMTTPLQPHTFRDVTDSEAPYGSRYMATEIKPGDPQWDIDAKGDTPKRRAECEWQKWRFEMGQDGWAGGAFYLPSDPMAKNGGTSIFQLHNWPNAGVMWNLHVANGRMKSDHHTFAYEMDRPLDPYLDRWNTMVVNFRPSTGKDGFIKMWLNDELVMAHAGPTRENGDEGPYFKHGNYFWAYKRWDKALRSLVYHDRLRIADSRGSYEAVDPNQW